MNTIRTEHEQNNNEKHNSHTEKPTSPLEAALYYLDHGCFVIPCCPMTPRGACTFAGHAHKDPKSIGKQPITGDGWQNLRLTREGIIWWWTKHPDANVGVLLEPSNLFVIDLDSQAATEEASRKGLPPGPQVRTGNGEHHCFHNRKKIIAATTHCGESGHIDVFSQGMVVGFGSTHRNGKRYELLVSWEEWRLEDPPLWAEELLLTALKKRSEAAEIPTDLPPVSLSTLNLPRWVLDVIRHGQPSHQEPYPSRSEAVWAVLMAMIEAGYDNDIIASVVLNSKHTISEKPRTQGVQWLAGEIGRARAKAATNGAEESMNNEQSHAKASTAGHTTSEEEPQTEGGTVHNDPDEEEEDEPREASLRNFPTTDLGNGERLKTRYGHNLLYNNLAKKFLTWDTQRWAVDDTQRVRRWARNTIRRLYKEVQSLTDDVKHENEKTQKKDLAKQTKNLLLHAVKSEAEARINAMIHNVQMDVPVVPKQLDADPWLLNVANGTLDLRTGQLSRHRREDRITKLIQIAYDSEAACPQWEAYLSAILAGNDDLIDFMWKSLGYSLTGDVREDCLFLLYGTGRNGKTTFIETTSAVLGDYATTAAFSTFLHQESDTVRNDIAALQGARFVSATEGDHGKRLSEAIIKRLTGKDTVSARFLFQEYFKFKPQLKLWLATNYKPVIQGTDDGIWSRIRLVPFTEKFEKEKDDKTLGDKLKAELPGILAWAVRGCLAWQKDGLPLPEKIMSATSDYRKEMDVFGNFLAECCVQKPHLRVRTASLYNAYVLWSGDKNISQNAFARMLTERGIERENVGGTIWRKGIALSTN